MKVYPLMLDGASISALVVGGGAVATRKVRGLLEGGARVTVVAPVISEDLHALASADDRLTMESRAYTSADVQPVDLVIAATNDRSVNRRVAEDARSARRLVNVADDPGAGNFVTASVHRSGDLTIAVSTGRAPAAAAAIRSEIAKRFDHRYASAIDGLRALRDRLLGAGQREAWKRASSELVGDSFCVETEQGTIGKRIASWH